MLELLDKFPPQNDKDLFDLLQFVKKSPFAKNYWQIFKSLYKKTELALTQEEFPTLKSNLLNLMGNLLFRIDQATFQELSSPFPTKATLRYMKRRGRRFMRMVAKNKAQDFVLLASKILLSNESKQNIDWESQWITADILMGNSRRCFQSGNGQGGYVFLSSVFQLHHREEKFSEIWDNELTFVQNLLEKNLPIDILEFALKILQANRIEMPPLNENILLRFFDSSSIFLQRTAALFNYQTFSYQGLKPALYAGMWFYSAHTLRKKIIEIDSKRPPKDNKWYEDFAQKLSEISIRELKKGISSRRVVSSIEFLQQHYPKQISFDSILSVASALFHSNNKSMQEMAFLGAQKADKSEVIEWLLALDNGKTTLNIPMFERLVGIFLPKFNAGVLRHEIEPYVFHTSLAVCDFGWRLAPKLRYEYDLYTIWSKLSNFGRRKIKEASFFNAITTMSGADAFIKNFQKYGYYFSYFSTQALLLIFQKGLDRVKKFVLRKLVDNFKTNALSNLSRVAALPYEIRDKILDEALPKLTDKDVFNYAWYINNVLEEANQNTWITDAILKIILVSKIENSSADNLLFATLGRGELAQKILAFINDLPNQKRFFFVSALAHNHDYVTQYAEEIPINLMMDALKEIDLDGLIQLTNQTNDTNWQKLKEVIYQQLLLLQEKEGFWKMILDSVLETENEQLSQRLIEDEKFFQLFKAQKDVGIIAITHPACEELLVDWLIANIHLFDIDTPELFALCIHKLPKIRQFAYELISKLGLTLRLGLQLLESDLPDAFLFAQIHFEKLPPQSEAEKEAALAFCDSPNQATRNFGLAFLAQRKEHFQQNSRIVEFLSEHSDLKIQQFVAEQIVSQKINQPFVQKFEKEILRIRNKGRKTKEIIKEKVAQSLNISANTLLEIAQKGTKQDAEWAIEQLVKKALAGEEIEGLELI